MPLLITTWQTRSISRFSISVEVLSICLVLDLGNPWWWNLPLQDHLPINSSEPFVVFYFFWSAVRAAHSQAFISTKEAPYQVSSFGLYVRRELIVAIHYFLIYAYRIIIVEWRITSEHLVLQNTSGPKVDGLAMALG